MTDAYKLDSKAADVLREGLLLEQQGNLAGARARVETALTLSSDDVGVRGVLGIMCCRMGDYPAGIAHFRTALSQRPTDIGLSVNLATALLQSGAPAEGLQVASEAAVKRDSSLRLWRLRAAMLQALGDHVAAAAAYRQIVARAPKDAESWNHLGKILRALGDIDGGIAALDRAAAFRPDILPMRLDLGAALRAAGRIEDAVVLFDGCAAAFPNDARPFAEIGSIVASLDRPGEAIGAYARAIELAPRDADLRVRLGEQLVSVWTLDEAEEAFRAALAIDPAHAVAHLQLAFLHDRTNRSDQFPALIADAEKQGVGDDVLNLMRALAFRREGRFADALAAIGAVPVAIESVRRLQLIGECRDRLGDAAGAFAAFTEMNRVRSGDPTDPIGRGEDFRRLLRAERALVTPEWFAGWPSVSIPAKRPAPVFLVGFPRSGTTLLDTMLLGHSHVQVLEERPPLRRIELEVNGFDRIPFLSAAEIEALRDRYFEEVASFVDLRPDSLLVDKFPMHMNKLPLIHRLFPDARVILMQRHPYDAVLSSFSTNFRLNNAAVNFLDLEHAATTYDLSFGFWEQCREIMPIRSHTIVYEKLVADSEAELRPLLDYLGLDWQAGVLDHQRIAAGREAIISPSYVQVTEPIYGRAVGRWERYREQIEPILPILRPWAEKMGYNV